MNDPPRMRSSGAAGEKPAKPWQFSLSQLFVAMIPVGLLFASLGAIGSTTWVHLLLAGLATTGYVALECFGDHSAPSHVSAFWRTTFFVARAAAFHETCFLLCLVSFWWQPAAKLPPGTPSIDGDGYEAVREAMQSFDVLVPYAAGFVVTSIIAWMASAIAADRIPRAGRFLAVTTLPGLFGIFAVWLAFFR